MILPWVNAVTLTVPATRGLLVMYLFAHLFWCWMGGFTSLPFPSTEQCRNYWHSLHWLHWKICSRIGQWEDVEKLLPSHPSSPVAFFRVIASSKLWIGNLCATVLLQRIVEELCDLMWRSHIGRFVCQTFPTTAGFVSCCEMEWPLPLCSSQ